MEKKYKWFCWKAYNIEEKTWCLTDGKRIINSLCACSEQEWGEIALYKSKSCLQVIFHCTVVHCSYGTGQLCIGLWWREHLLAKSSCWAFSQGLVCEPSPRCSPACSRCGSLSPPAVVSDFCLQLFLTAPGSCSLRMQAGRQQWGRGASVLSQAGVLCWGSWWVCQHFILLILAFALVSVLLILGRILLVGFPARKHASEGEDIFLALRSEAACSLVLEHVDHVPEIMGLMLTTLNTALWKCWSKALLLFFFVSPSFSPKDL